MSEATSHQILRNQNLSLVLDTLLQHESLTRKQVEDRTSLSKATVSRLVDDLLKAGALLASPTSPDPTARGRRPRTISTSRSLGTSAGLSIGVRTSVVCVTDLHGRKLLSREIATPKWTSLEEAVEWMAGVVAGATPNSHGPLRQLVVALPARTIDGRVLTPLPLFMSVVEGPELAQLLQARLSCPVRLELDAAMILAGLEVLGRTERDAQLVLLNLDAVLTMTLRRADGTTAEGRGPAFGNFDLIPIETDVGTSSVGRLLGAHGLFETSQHLGSPLQGMEELWHSDSEVARRLRDAFRVALLQALRTIVVMSDPSLVVLTGRLAPLAQRHLDGVRAALHDDVADPPTIEVVVDSDNGHAAALGAALHARARAVQALLDRVATEGGAALRSAELRRHAAVKPPSIGRTAPVTYDDAGEARK
jgi:predicted NBD/HSP70 family sugar kinase